MQQSLELLCLLLIIPDRLILISTEDTNNFKIYRNLTFLYLHSSYFTLIKAPFNLSFILKTNRRSQSNNDLYIHNSRVPQMSKKNFITVYIP